MPGVGTEKGSWTSWRTRRPPRHAGVNFAALIVTGRPSSAVPAPGVTEHTDQFVASLRPGRMQRARRGTIANPICDHTPTIVGGAVHRFSGFATGGCAVSAEQLQTMYLSDLRYKTPPFGTDGRTTNAGICARTARSCIAAA